MARRAASSGFQSDIVTFVAKVGQRLDLVPRIASTAVVADVRTPIQAGGHLPYRTGNLSRSLVASIDTMPSSNYTPAEGELLKEPRSQIASVINSLRVGDRLFLVFTVAYAAAQNRKHAFIDATAMKWKSFVDVAAEKAKKVIR
jgi:hypothetical protein